MCDLIFDFFKNLNSFGGILWIGEPNGLIMLKKTDWFIFAFGILLSSCSLFLIFMARQFLAIFPLFGLPFLFISIIIILSKIIFNILRLKHKSCEITREKILTNQKKTHFKSHLFNNTYSKSMLYNKLSMEKLHIKFNCN